jgi:hypothetical protein
VRREGFQIFGRKTREGGSKVVSPKVRSNLKREKRERRAAFEDFEKEGVRESDMSNLGRQR